jgi:hypothetical protein
MKRVSMKNIVMDSESWAASADAIEAGRDK